MAAYNYLEIILVMLILLLDNAEAYIRGEYVHASWQGQGLRWRTRWIDVLARDCPRFGVDTITTLTIPSPYESLVVMEDSKRVQSFPLDVYKICLSVESETHQTTWLTVLEKVPSTLLPGIKIQMVHDSMKILKESKVKLEASVDDEESNEESSIIAEALNIHNVTSWPKTFLVKYTWIKHDEHLDVDTAIIAIFLISMLVTSTTILYFFQMTFHRGHSRVGEEKYLTELLTEATNELLMNRPLDSDRVDSDEDDDHDYDDGFVDRFRKYE